MTEFEARALGILERIAIALEKVADPAPDVEPEAPRCEHPADQRIAFGGMQGDDEWQCGACGYSTVNGVD